MFEGNLMREQTVDVEIKSAKGQGKTGKVGGSGETQLEMEKYNIKLREAKVRKELAELQAREDNLKIRKVGKHDSVPTVALVGYTNAGKTALMNMCAGAALKSEDRLFMTLDTASRQVRLPNQQNAKMLDTVGFISNLPH